MREEKGAFLPTSSFDPFDLSTKISWRLGGGGAISTSVSFQLCGCVLLLCDRTLKPSYYALVLCSYGPVLVVMMSMRNMSRTSHCLGTGVSNNALCFGVT